MKFWLIIKIRAATFQRLISLDKTKTMTGNSEKGNNNLWQTIINVPHPPRPLALYQLWDRGLIIGDETVNNTLMTTHNALPRLLFFIF